MDGPHTDEGWDEILDHLADRRRASRAMGGDERLKHRGAGKLDARARIDHLLDPGSFLELGTLVGGEEAPPDAALSRARGSDEEEAARLRAAALEASFRSVRTLGFDELIDPREIRNVLLASPERALHRRQQAAEPVARIGIAP